MPSPTTSVRPNLNQVGNLGGSHVQTKFIVVTGGTVSGLGKGTAISSLGVVLKSHGLRVTAMKIDPYLNVDAGTMSPFEHGECFVLEDGGEADLDLGNYERFLDLTLSAQHSLTSGKIYEKVLRRERAGDFLGKTVQMVPHVTNAIQDWIFEISNIPTDIQGGSDKPDICLVELGGTVGDIESAVYLEALQQMSFSLGSENFLCIHLGYVPYMGATGEQKTKPCQHSVKIMREAGLKPDFLFCRSSSPLCPDIRKKLGLFCQLQSDEIISLHDCSNIFKVPLLLAEQNLGELICKKLKLDSFIHKRNPVLGGVIYNTKCVNGKGTVFDLATAGVNVCLGGGDPCGRILSRQNTEGVRILSRQNTDTMPGRLSSAPRNLDVIDKTHAADALPTARQSLSGAIFSPGRNLGGVSPAPSPMHTPKASGATASGQSGPLSGPGTLSASAASAEGDRQNTEPRLLDWEGLACRVDNLSVPLKIAIIGKYTGLTDSYMSVIKALHHATIEAGVLMEIEWIESTKLEKSNPETKPEEYKDAWVRMKACKGVLVPGGFGTRGIEGMIAAAKYCRETKTPYFGICVGLQVATIEACRSLLKLEKANSSEFDPESPDPCVIFMPEHSTSVMGGTMRLGSRCTIIRNTESLASKIYSKQPVVFERHRHRYEVNIAYRTALENNGFIFSGQDERGQRMEIAEYDRNLHPFFVGVQFHPEFKSRPNRPSPTFLAFVLASCGKLEERVQKDGGVLVLGNGFKEPVYVEDDELWKLQLEHANTANQILDSTQQTNIMFKSPSSGKNEVKLSAKIMQGAGSPSASAGNGQSALPGNGEPGSLVGLAPGIDKYVTRNNV